MASPIRIDSYNHTWDLKSTCQHTAQNLKLNFTDDLTKLLTITGSENRNIALLRDLNIHIDNSEEPNADQLMATLEAFGLKQHIRFLTHQLGHTLDLIATESTIKLTCPPLSGPYLSDHRMVIIETKNKKLTETPQYREYGNLTEAVMTEFQQSFNNQPILDATNLEDTINQLNDQMLRNLNKVAPMKKRRSMKKAPKLWFSKDLLDQRKIVKSREQKWLKYKEPYQWTAFKRERNCYNQMIKFHKRQSIFTNIKANHNNTGSSIKQFQVSLDKITQTLSWKHTQTKNQQKILQSSSSKK